MSLNHIMKTYALYLLCSYFQTQTLAASCTLFYDNMDDPVSTGWTFDDRGTSGISSGGSCASSKCTLLGGTSNYPMMTRTFSWFTSSTLSAFQIKYFIRCYSVGYLVQFKWSSDSEWTDLYYDDGYVGPINYIHNLGGDLSRAGDLSLSVRFRYYKASGPMIYIDNFYLMATSSSCPTTEAPITSTMLIEEEPNNTLSSETMTTIVLSAGGVIFVAVICCVVFLCHKRSKSKGKETKNAVSENIKTEQNGPSQTNAEVAEQDDHCNKLEVNTADNEEMEDGQIEGDEIRTVVTVK